MSRITPKPNSRKKNPVPLLTLASATRIITVLFVLVVLQLTHFKISLRQTESYDNETGKTVSKFFNVLKASITNNSSDIINKDILMKATGTNTTKNTTSTEISVSNIYSKSITNENTTTITTTAVTIISNNTNSSGTVPTSSHNTQIRNKTMTMLSSASTNTTQIDVYNNSSDIINKDIVIEMRFPRMDRLGTHLQRPLFLMAYAHCEHHSFCIVEGRQGYARYFPGFDICPDNLMDHLDHQKWPAAGESLFNTEITKPGIYSFKRDDNLLMKWRNKHDDCAFDEPMRKKWGEMIVGASFTDWIKNHTLVEEDLFEKTNDPNVVTVAINIRRGDFTDWQRKVVLDQYYVIMLRHLRSLLKKAGKNPEVHLFSEDYGMIDVKRNIDRNWTMYDGLVEHFHLAPDMRKKRNPHVVDMDLNLRDWRHFVKVDILIVGGSFSRIPALGRPKHPDPTTGLPLTINLWNTPDEDGSTTKYRTGWSSYDYGVLPDAYEIINLPEVFAKHDTIPMEVFFEDLIADWNATYNNNSQ